MTRKIAMQQRKSFYCSGVLSLLGVSSMREQNAVRHVVEVLGGPTKVANLVGCSGNTVHNWMREGRIRHAKDAVVVARAALAVGKPVPIEVLAGVDQWAHPTGGAPSPTPGAPQRGRARGQSTPSLSRSAVASAASAFSHASAPGGRRRVVLGGSQAANG